ncbi:GNAT family N-acetyltransferase [Emergencia sp.]|uniref:GNAT family N-acetyltransferase n=1 Tax=Emergencia sp. TaxID=1926557 RepID=UPI003AF005C2
MKDIVTKRLIITEAGEEHLDTIIALESHPENRDYLWIGTYEEHAAEIDDPNHLLLIFKKKKDGVIVGYALIRLDFKSNVFELRRIAISEKAAGFGREAMAALLRFSFEEMETNRFWLDVYPDNLVGIKLYESLGMHRDGVLRQNYKAERGYLDQIIYSMLRSEYEAFF